MISDVVPLIMSVDKNNPSIRSTDIVPIAHYVNNNTITIETVSLGNFVPYSLKINNIQYKIDKQNTKITIANNFSLDSITNPRLIPKKIMQTWKTKDIEGTDINYPVTVVKKMNPEYVHTLLDDNDCIEYIKKYYGKRELDAYLLLKPAAYRADLFRYLYLYKEGGFYLDIKSSPLQPFYSMIDNKQEILLVKDIHNHGIYNGLIACVPGHPMIKIAYEESIARIERRFYGTKNSFLITGPGLFKWAFNKWLSLYLHKDITDFIKQDVIAWQHLYEVDGYSIFNTKNIKTFNRIFSTYYAKYNKSETHYATLWANKDVYYKNTTTTAATTTAATTTAVTTKSINNINKLLARR